MEFKSQISFLTIRNFTSWVNWNLQNHSNY